MCNNWSFILKMNNEELSFIMICSFRYCLGRMTYAPDYFKDILFNNLENVTENTINIIIKEISECDNFGRDCDKQTWIKVQKRLIKFKNN